jgi:hypothetical protein
MTPQDHTARLLQQWLQMTRAESQAIQSGAWTKLHQIQSSKAALRQPLAEAYRRCKSAAPPVPVLAAGVSARSLPFRAEVARLIVLEEHNARLLAVRRERACEQKHLMERAAQNLRNLRRTYAPPSPPVACNSYS